MKVSGKILDIHCREIYPGIIHFNNGLIETIERTGESADQFICPGIIDSHIHVESSMLTPGSFAMAAVSRGTTAVVSDPHEIANVLGIEGVRYMIEDSKKVPLKFYFGAPSCVPATSFETSGSVVDAGAIDELLAMKEIKYLAEMMNFPGVLSDDPEVFRKINSAKKNNKPIDGHAPGLTGEKLYKYISAGISTDHECVSKEEALEKLSLGMKILIREGSAAKNLNELKDLLKTHPDRIMLCSDDLHPEMLAERHINKIAAQLINEGFNLFDVIRSCTLNPVLHYNLDAGLLQPGQPADFIITDDYHKMDILETWINGEKVFEKNNALFYYSGAKQINKFNCSEISTAEIRIPSKQGKIRVIKAFDGELITKETIADARKIKITGADIKNDILKIIVKDRYTDFPPAVAFINGFGLKSGAFAGSVAHDSHNIIGIGTNDEDIVNAVNEVIRMKGGLVVANGNVVSRLPLPVAGIMTDKPVAEVSAKYKLLSETVKSAGCKFSAPFMTLSFMALLVIPELKISDRGLFDGNNFCHVPLFLE
jgi:adenine deaminase